MTQRLSERMRAPDYYCAIHNLKGACTRCADRQEAYEKWWDSMPTQGEIPEFNLEDYSLEDRTEITHYGYCKCGHWFTATELMTIERIVRRHSNCRYRKQIQWHTNDQLQLF